MPARRNVKGSQADAAVQAKGPNLAWRTFFRRLGDGSLHGAATRTGGRVETEPHRRGQENLSEPCFR